MWINHNQTNYQEENQKISIQAKPFSDMVVDCQTKSITSNASFLTIPKGKEFSIQAKVSHSFLSCYDACCLIAYANDTLWAKACFECSESMEHYVVTVMTDSYSDDANACAIQQDFIYLRLNRRNDIVSVQYSLDGKNWIFVRILSLSLPDQVEVGILAQSPIGNGGTFYFEEIQIQDKAPENMRLG